MGYSIELDEETSRRLHEEAARLNRDAQSLGLEYVREKVQDQTRVEEAEESEARVANFRRMLSEVQEFARQHPMPSLPDEALTREAMYADHD